MSASGSPPVGVTRQQRAEARERLRRTAEEAELQQDDAGSVINNPSASPPAEQAATPEPEPAPPVPQQQQAMLGPQPGASLNQPATLPQQPSVGPSSMAPAEALAYQRSIAEAATRAQRVAEAEREEQERGPRPGQQAEVATATFMPAPSQLHLPQQPPQPQSQFAFPIQQQAASPVQRPIAISASQKLSDAFKKVHRRRSSGESYQGGWTGEEPSVEFGIPEGDESASEEETREERHERHRRRREERERTAPGQRVSFEETPRKKRHHHRSSARTASGSGLPSPGSQAESDMARRLTESMQAASQRVRDDLKSLPPAKSAEEQRKQAEVVQAYQSMLSSAMASAPATQQQFAAQPPSQQLNPAAAPFVPAPSVSAPATSPPRTHAHSTRVPSQVQWTVQGTPLSLAPPSFFRPMEQQLIRRSGLVPSMQQESGAQQMLRALGLQAQIQQQVPGLFPSLQQQQLQQMMQQPAAQLLAQFGPGMQQPFAQPHPSLPMQQSQPQQTPAGATIFSSWIPGLVAEQPQPQTHTVPLPSGAPAALGSSAPVTTAPLPPPSGGQGAAPPGAAASGAAATPSGSGFQTPAAVSQRRKSKRSRGRSPSSPSSSSSSSSSESSSSDGGGGGRQPSRRSHRHRSSRRRSHSRTYDVPIAANGLPDIEPSKQQLDVIKPGNPAKITPELESNSIPHIIAYKVALNEFAARCGARDVLEDNLIFWHWPTDEGTASAMRDASTQMAVGLTPDNATLTRKQQKYKDYELKLALFVRHAIMDSVKKVREFQMHLLNLPTPVVIPFLRSLDKRVQSGRDPMIITLMTALQQRRRGKDESITAYQTAFMTIVNNLTILGHKHDEEDLRQKFLANADLPEHMRNILVNRRSEGRADSIEDIANLVQTFNMNNDAVRAMNAASIAAAAVKPVGGKTNIFNTDTADRGQSGGGGNSAAPKADANGLKTKVKGNCNLCGKPGHWAADCRSAKKGGQKQGGAGQGQPASNSGEQQQRGRARGSRGGTRRQQGDGQQQQGGKQNGQRARATCTNCKVKGHTVETCFHLHPDLAPARWHEQQEAKAGKVDAALSSQCQHLSASFSSHQGAGKAAHSASSSAFAVAPRKKRGEARDPLMCLDSGADFSVATTELGVENLRLVRNGSIVTAGKEEMRRPSMGTIPLGKNAAGDELKLECLVHPDVRRNLLSVNKLLHVPGVKAIKFSRTHATVLDHADEPLLYAPFIGGQYQVRKSRLEHMFTRARQPAELAKQKRDAAFVGSFNRRPLLFNSESRAADHRWHNILGHLRKGKLNKLLKRDEPVVTGRGLTLASARYDDCPTCARAKQARRSFKQFSAERRAKAPLESVSADLMGPFRTETPSGHLYVLVIIDDFSGRVWLRLLRQKADAADAIISWSRRQHTRMGRWPTNFHSDRGGEFSSDKLLAHWAECGTRRSTTLPYSPQQNGRVERFNRVIIELVRSAFVESAAPLVLWGEAMIYLSSLYNAVSADDDGQVPIVKYDRLPTPINLDAFHVWGCTAMVHYSIVEQRERGKLAAVARPLMFIGRGSNLAWRFASTEDGALHCVESRDCTFNDADFSAAQALKRELAGTELGAADRFNPAYFGNELNELAEYEGEGEMQAAMEESLRSRRAEQAAQQQHRPAVAPIAPELTDESELDEPEDLFEQAAAGRDASAATQPSLTDEEPESSLGPMKRVSFPAGDGDEAYEPPRARRSEAAMKPLAEADTKYPEAARRSTRGAKPYHRYGVVDPRDFGAGALYAQGIKELENAFDKAFFDPSPAATAAQSEGERLRTLFRFEHNVEVNERDLAPCNRKGERVVPTRQCCAPAASGQRCGKYTTLGAFCWIHLAKVLGLRVKPSTLGAEAGRGLFTTIPHKAGDEVCRYTGDLVHGPDPNFKGSLYVAQIDRQNFIDAARTDAHLGRMVNAPRQATGRSTNLRWVINHQRKTVRLVASKDIPAGAELFIGYGGGYWSRFRAAQPKKGAPPKNLGIKKIFPAPAKAAHAQLHRATALSAASQATSCADPDPRTLAEAMASPDWPRWAEAIAEEEKSLAANGTFTPIDVPPGTKLLDCKWVFKRKRDHTGAVVRYKVRLVAKGFRQLQSVDYDDTFSPVMGMTSLRMMVAIAAQRRCELTMADFKTAYLNAELDKNILVRVPEGMRSFPRAHALQCNRALYGLHQSGRLWYQTLVDQLVSMGYSAQSDGEQCALVRKLASGRSIILGIYVDDILIVWDKQDEAAVQSDIKQLDARYKLTLLGEAKHILGIEVIRDRSVGTIKLAQAAYLKRLCADLGFEQCRKERTPASTGQLVDHDTLERSKAAAAAAGSSSSALASQPLKSSMHHRVSIETFREVLGRLMYAANCTRPDIAQAVNALACVSANPTQESIVELKRLLRYISNTLTLGITYTAAADPSAACKLSAFSDANWGGCSETRRSTTGSALMLAGAAIEWRSKRQDTVAQSSAEAEYIAGADTAKSIVYLRQLLQHLTCPQRGPTQLFMDSQAAIRIAMQDSNNQRRKHIDIKHHFLREQALGGIIELVWVPTADEVADIFTKPLPVAAFLKHRRALLNGGDDEDEAPSAQQSPAPEQAAQP